VGKRHRIKKKFSFVSLAVLVVSFLLIFFYQPVFNSAKTKLSFGKLNSQVIESIPCNPNIDYDRKVIFETNKHGIIKSEQNSFIFYNVEGKALWEKEINSSSAMVRLGDSFIIAADSGTGELYSLTFKGEINKSIGPLGRIKDILVGENDVIVLVLEQDNEVVLLDKTLEEITRISLPNGDLIDFDLSANKSLLAFSFIKMDKTNFYSNVLLYSLDGRLIGATNFEQQYIYDVKVIEDQVIGVLDNEVFVLGGDNEMIQSLEIDRRIESFCLDESGLIILNLTKNPEELTDTRPDNVISVLDLKGKMVMPDIIVEAPISQLLSSELYLTFLSGDKIYQMDKATGELLKIQTLEKDALGVRMINKSILGVEYIDKFDIYSLAY
jgi:hypothetical protein